MRVNCVDCSDELCEDTGRDVEHKNESDCFVAGKNHKTKQGDQLKLRDLLPCPFCGGEPEIIIDGGQRSNMVYVCCSQCYSRGEDFNKFATTPITKAGTSWNKRIN